MDKLSRLIAFDIKGPMAHFRKYYTNSSSLSYAFPPRTVITGIIAGMLGLARDSYYEKFSSKACHVGVSIVTPVRSIHKSVNYLLMEAWNDVKGMRGTKGHTQVPLEILLPKDFTSDSLCYRVYFWHREEEIMNALEKRLKERRFVYPPYLGLSEFIAFVSDVFTPGSEDIEVKKPDESYVDVVTVCNMDMLQEKGLSFQGEGGSLQYIKEIAPLDFTHGRQSMIPAYFVYEKKQRRLRVKLNRPYVSVNLNGERENITFMEAG